MFWLWRPYNLAELVLLISVGLLANISQLFLFQCYKLAPVGQIGPVNYIAIILPVFWAIGFGKKLPDTLSLVALDLFWWQF